MNKDDQSNSSPQKSARHTPSPKLEGETSLPIQRKGNPFAGNLKTVNPFQLVAQRQGNPTKTPTPYLIYVVPSSEFFETVGGIAERFGTTVEALEKLNGASFWGRFRVFVPGSKVKIPKKPTAAPKPAAEPHQEVKPQTPKVQPKPEEAPIPTPAPETHQEAKQEAPAPTTPEEIVPEPTDKFEPPITVPAPEKKEETPLPLPIPAPEQKEAPKPAPQPETKAQPKPEEVKNKPVKGVPPAKGKAKVAPTGKPTIMPEDVPIEAGKKVITGYFNVNGVPFIKWFNDTLLPKYPKAFENFHAKDKTPIKMSEKNLASIEAFMKSFPALSGRKTGIPINEFAAYFCIVYQETGAKFHSVTEYGGSTKKNKFADAKYFFEAKEGIKSSYNLNAGLGNRKAGDQLLEWKVISSQADVNLWNSGTFPESQPEKVKEAAKECDFYRFRGRGLVQTTGRDNYAKLNHLVSGKKVTDRTNKELDELFDDPEFAAKAVYTFYRQSEKSASSLREATQGEFWRMGKITNGGKVYADHMQLRAEAISKELEAAKLTNA